VRSLDGTLREAQLWSKVSVEDDTIVIESALCEDPGVWAAIMAEAVSLRDAGITTARCQAQHGGVVFDRKL
jgi:hypothetical protein